MSLDDSEGLDDVGVEPQMNLGLEAIKEDEKVINPSDALTVAGALGAIAGRDRFADVWFNVGSGKDQKRVPGHRVVLAASSDIFEAMLYPIEFPDDKPAAASGKEEKNDLEIDIPDVKPSVFRTMLQAVYGDTAEIKAEELPDLIACAKKFQLEGLRTLCVTFMEEGVNVDNACTLFESAQQLLNEKQFALSFIEENAMDVIASPSFDLLPLERVVTIIKSDKLAIDEIDLFQGVLRWGVAQLKKQKLDDTIDNKKKILKDLLPLVRFPLMNMEEVATAVSPSGLLEAPQLLEIFTYLGQPDNKKPKISFNARSRAGATDKWMLDATYKSATLTLSGKNMSVTNASSNHAYVLGTQTWTKGQHAWRVSRNTGQSQWLLLGVSRKESHPDASYSQPGFYGFSSASQRYMAGQASTVTTNFANGPLDCLYDADKGTFVVLNQSGQQRYEITGIPKNVPMVPHFGPHSNQQITVSVIRAKEFGKRR